MLELGLLAISAGYAAKVSLIILGIAVALYLVLAIGCHYGGLEFLLTCYGIGVILFWLAIIFGVIFLAVLGIGALC